jgi:hypothetical protein
MIYFLCMTCVSFVQMFWGVLATRLGGTAQAEAFAITPRGCASASLGTRG